MFHQLTTYMISVAIWTIDLMALNQAFNVIVTHLCVRLYIIESHHKLTSSHLRTVTVKALNLICSRLLVRVTTALCNSSISRLARIRTLSEELLLIKAHRAGKMLNRSS